MKIEFISAVILIVILFGVWTFVFKPIIKEDRIMKDFCEQQIITPCSYPSIECYNNCNDFGLEYFRFDDGGFSSDECWCQVNNGTKQIW